MPEIVSGEEFSCSAAQFAGMRVKEVQPGSSWPGMPYWAIVFEAGGAILGYDPMVPRPTTLVGAGFTRLVLSAKGTDLWFGLEKVTIDGTKYAIFDEQITQGKVVFPQATQYNQALRAAQSMVEGD